MHARMYDLQCVSGFETLRGVVSQTGARLQVWQFHGSLGGLGDVAPRKQGFHDPGMSIVVYETRCLTNTID